MLFDKAKQADIDLEFSRLTIGSKIFCINNKKLNTDPIYISILAVADS